MKHLWLCGLVLLSVGMTACGNSVPAAVVTPPVVTPAAAIKMVQTANVTTPDQIGPVTVSFTNNVTTNDLVVIIFWWNYAATPNVVSVTDSAGNSYKNALVTPPGNGNNAWIYYATNVTGGSPLSITVSLNQTSNGQFSMAALEYSGLSALDVTSTNSGSMTSDSTASTSGNVVTHASNELIVGVSLSNEFTTTMAGSGFANRFSSNYFMVEDKIVSASGTYDAEFFLPTGCPFCAWQAGVATFH